MAFRINAVLALLASAADGAADTFFSVDADPFLGRHVETRLQVREMILDAIDDGFEGRAGIDKAVAEKQSQLRQGFDSLPHNRHGNLDSAGTRYLLYQHFVQQRAWPMQGLKLEGEARNASFPVELLRVPSEVKAVVQGRLIGRGLSLYEVAVLAKMVESQVHGDAFERLEVLWEFNGLSSEDHASKDVVQKILEAHTMTYILPTQFILKQMLQGETSLDEVEKLRQNMLYFYPGWERLQILQRDSLQALQSEDAAVYNVEQSMSAVRQVVDQFGRLQNEECQELKQKLISLEGPRPGRVDLATFYSVNFNNEKWMFDEPVDYIRLVGALDETDPNRPGVIIPNYVTSAVNIVGGSSDFGLVCLDECDSFLSHLQRRVGAAASVEQVASAVATLPFFSRPSPITNELLRKLQDVATADGGEVQLSGRLFALWLHHMYPQDCPYPHAAGTTKQMNLKEYADSTGLEATESHEEMQRIIDEAAAAPAETTPIPWDTQEELLGTSPEGPPTVLLGGLALAMAMLGVAASFTGRARWLRSNVSRAPLLDIGASHSRAAASGTQAEPRAAVIAIDASS